MLPIVKNCKRLDKQARELEQHIVKWPSVEEIIAHEKEVSSLFGGKSVFGDEE